MGEVQGVRLAVAHLLVAIGNLGGLLEGISFNNIMVVREFIIDKLKINRQITCINYSLGMHSCNNCIHT